MGQFMKYDENNDGLLSLAEFGKLVRALATTGAERGGGWSAAEVRAAFQRAAVARRAGARSSDRASSRVPRRAV